MQNKGPYGPIRAHMGPYGPTRPLYGPIWALRYFNYSIYGFLKYMFVHNFLVKHSIPLGRSVPFGLKRASHKGRKWSDSQTQYICRLLLKAG